MHWPPPENSPQSSETNIILQILINLQIPINLKILINPANKQQEQTKIILECVRDKKQ